MAKNKKSANELVTVAPVAGHFLTGIPAVAHQVDRARADELIATGAFEEGDSDTELAETGGLTLDNPIAQVPRIAPAESADTADLADTASDQPIEPEGDPQP